jgi:dihydroorotate dehydrogenase electron transfer subunit
MMRKFLAPVVSVTPLTAPGHFVLTFEAPELAREALPGHFIAVLADYPWGAGQQILRKPFSVYMVDTETGWCRILFSLYGSTTRRMAQMQPGDTLDFLGPLGGRVFDADPQAQSHHVLVGGGYGVPPLAFLARRLKTANPDAQVTLIHGARTANLLVGADGLREAGITVLATTDDGSFGIHGRVTAALEPLIHTGEPLCVYTCGPTPMMRAVAERCVTSSVPCQVSMETFMPCGVGICVGCAVPRPDASYARACTDGPVFPATEVVWE